METEYPIIIKITTQRVIGYNFAYQNGFDTRWHMEGIDKTGKRWAWQRVDHTNRKGLTLCGSGYGYYRLS